MSSPTNVQILTQLETQIRQGSNDRNYLIQQLLALGGILGHERDRESGLARGALGGMLYCIDRLREHWKDPDAPAKTLEELAEIYATVELTRYTTSKDRLKEVAEQYKKDYVLVNAHKVDIEGVTYYLLSSASEQTTPSGEKLQAGQMLELGTPEVPNFQTVLKELIKLQG